MTFAQIKRPGLYKRTVTEDTSPFAVWVSEVIVLPRRGKEKMWRVLRNYEGSLAHYVEAVRDMVGDFELVAAFEVAQ